MNKDMKNLKKAEKEYLREFAKGGKFTLQQACNLIYFNAYIRQARFMDLLLNNRDIGHFGWAMLIMEYRNKKKEEANGVAPAKS